MNRDEAAGDRMQTICTYAIDPACKRTSSGQSPSNLTPRSINCTYDACRVHAFRVRPSSRIRRRYSCGWARLITRKARRLVACHSASKFCMPNDTLSPRCARRLGSLNRLPGSWLARVDGHRRQVRLRERLLKVTRRFQRQRKIAHRSQR